MEHQYVTGFRVDLTTGRVLLIEKKRPAWHAGQLNGIGGSIESGETPLQAIVREFKEETGKETSPEEWTHTITINRPGAVIYVFYSEGDLIGCESKTDELLVWAYFTSPPINLLPDAWWSLLLSMDQGVVFPIEVSYMVQPWERVG